GGGRKSTYLAFMSDRSDERALALDIRPRRFGFVIFEGPTMLLDCGVKSFYSSRRKAVKMPPSFKIRPLIRDYAPAVIVMRERERHIDRARILQSVQRLAREAGIPFTFLSREEIADMFAAAEKNKNARNGHRRAVSRARRETPATP